MFTPNDRIRFNPFVLATLLALGGCAGMASAQIAEEDTVLLYNPKNFESKKIAKLYTNPTRHPDVLLFPLAIVYSANPEVDEFHITPEAFESLVRGPLLQFLSDKPNIKVIVTTRGLPATIATLPFPSPGAVPDHNRDKIHASFEATLARLDYGLKDVEGNLVYNRDPNSAPSGVSNPYHKFLGVTFAEFLAMDPAAQACLPGAVDGSQFIGKIFLVSRLDSASTFDDNGDEILTPVDNVKLMLDREMVINKRATTLVYDDYTDIECKSFDPELCGVHTMFNLGWCVYLDDTMEFLDGANEQTEGLLKENFEGTYNDYPELMHATLGGNHSIPNSTCNGQEPPPDYIQQYMPHPAGLFISIESFNGTSIRDPGNTPSGHGQVLEWIAAGGSFTCGNVYGPQASVTARATHVVENLYEHGLTWGESIYTSLRLIGDVQTPIGDPLARVVVYDPDLNGDLIVDGLDVAILAAAIVTQDPVGDINKDGTVDGNDMQFIDEVLINGVTERDCTSDPGVTINCSPGSNCTFKHDGDWNENGLVDQLDLDAILDGLEFAGLGNMCLRADMDCDENITVEDIRLVLCNWGRRTPNGDCAPAGGNNEINVDDLASLLAAWGDGGGGSCSDINDDGTVNVTDLIKLLAVWGPSPPDPTTPDLRGHNDSGQLFVDIDANNIPDDCQCITDISPVNLLTGAVGDGVTDWLDEIRTRSEFNDPSPNCAGNCASGICLADFDRDCDVDLDDLLAVVLAPGDCVIPIPNAFCGFRLEPGNATIFWPHDQPDITMVDEEISQIGEQIIAEDFFIREQNPPLGSFPITDLTWFGMEAPGVGVVVDHNDFTISIYRNQYQSSMSGVDTSIVSLPSDLPSDLLFSKIVTPAFPENLKKAFMGYTVTENGTDEYEVFVYCVDLSSLNLFLPTEECLWIEISSNNNLATGTQRWKWMPSRTTGDAVRAVIPQGASDWVNSSGRHSFALSGNLSFSMLNPENHIFCHEQLQNIFIECVPAAAFDDCNNNGIEDLCDILLFGATDPDFEDLNNNFIPDGCEP